MVVKYIMQVPLGEHSGKRIVQTDSSLNMVGVHLPHQVKLLGRISSVIDKVVVALDAQIFGRLVQTQEHGKAPSGEFPGIGSPGQPAH